MIGDPSSEQHRARVGFLVLAAGLLLLLWAWGSWFYRTSVQETVPAAQTEHEPTPPPERHVPNTPDREKVVRAMPSFLLVGALLVLVFLFGTYAFLRFSRRYRQLIEHRRAPPADARDLWSMHQVPNYDEDEFP